MMHAPERKHATTNRRLQETCDLYLHLGGRDKAELHCGSIWLVHGIFHRLVEAEPGLRTAMQEMFQEPAYMQT